MKSLGLTTCPVSEVLKSFDEAIRWHHDLERRRDDLDFEIDGCVFKVNALADHERLGMRSANPRWAVAYKFTPRQKTTRILSIDPSVGRTGAVTPVATLEPVEIGGVTVTHVSLHNQDEIDRKDIRVGDTVLVERAGDVIPHVVQVIAEKRPHGAKPWRLPAKCPVCGAEVEKPEGEAISRCTSNSCPAQLKESLKHWGSKQAVDIDGLGDKIVDQLVDRGLVQDVADLYDLKPPALADLERMGEKSAANLVEQIAGSKKATLARVIHGLGIRHVGRRWPRRWPASSSRSRTLRPPTRSGCWRCPTWGRRWPPRSAPGSRTSRTWASWRSCAATASTRKARCGRGRGRRRATGRQDRGHHRRT